MLFLSVALSLFVRYLLFFFHPHSCILPFPKGLALQGLYDLACDYSFFFSFGYHLYTYIPIYQDLQGKKIINSRVNNSNKNCIVYVVVTLH